MKLLTLDFETYFSRDYSLKKQTIPEYVTDPRFHVHGLAIQLPDTNAMFRTDVPEALEELKQQFGERLEQTTVVCHHAQFDCYILNHKYDLRPCHIIDTLLLASHVHGPGKISGQALSLRALAERYGLDAKGELEFMLGVRRVNPSQLAELGRYARQDVHLTSQLAIRLLPKITRPEIELQIAQHTLRLFTERGIRIDVPGIGVLENEIREHVDSFLTQAAVTRASISNNKEFHTLLESALARVGRSVPMKSGKNGMIPATASKDPEMQALTDDDDPVVSALAQARLRKKSEDQKLARLATLRRIAAATGGVLPPCLHYFGGHTGRFSGGGGFNIQNMARSGLGGRTRNLLIPQPGHVFVIADLAQVEARITAWFAGEESLLQAFAAGADVYSEFASRVFGQPVCKANDGASTEQQSQFTAMREVGKQAVLGLGFQMGALEFMKQLRAKPLVAHLFDTGQLTPPICHQIVRSFRQEYSQIGRLWQCLDESVRRAIDGVKTQTERLTIDRDGDVTTVCLPSDRALRYEDVRLDHTSRSIRFLGEDGMEHDFQPDAPAMLYARKSNLYGGKLCENIVQATARDLLVDAILRLEEAGLRVLFHVHDELIVEVPTADVESAQRIVTDELSHEPSWAPGLPVACEVQPAAHYTK
jgi:DNA polymerase bacteriophage-type